MSVSRSARIRDTRKTKRRRVSIWHDEGEMALGSSLDDTKRDSRVGKGDSCLFVIVNKGGYDLNRRRCQVVVQSQDWESREKCLIRYIM